MNTKKSIHRRRPQPKNGSSKRRSALLSSIAFALPLGLDVCIAGSHYESELFSSSVVSRDITNDLSSSASLSRSRRPLQQGYTHHGLDLPNLRIHRSFIDRDPIYYDEYGQHALFSEDDMMDPNVMDSFFSSYNHDPQTNPWQSPLETMAPLPSLSLESNPSAMLSSIFTKESQPTTIHNGPRHSHEIDISQQQQNPQTNAKIKTRSTGTTITALLAANSSVVILAADTRATDGSTVADKRCEKLHTLAKNVWCAGAGTSADVDALVRRVKFTFWKRNVLTTEGYGGVGNMNTNTNNRNNGKNGEWDMDATISNEDCQVPPASVPAILHYLRTTLTKSRGYLGVNLLVGGYDHSSSRAHLAAVHPHGSMDILTYAALGSGGLAATGVLESKYPRIGCADCSIEEGIVLAVDAVRAGVENDLGSGSQVDVCVIRKEGVLYRRAVVREEEIEWMTDGWKREEEEKEENGKRLSMEDDRGQGRTATGVNGFGNVPFAIQSQRVVSGGQLGVERERSQWLAEVIGGAKTMQ